ncbi:peroxiredoxin family protein [Haloplanus natans]|uniref:peroxiredoxin family protein n=1 Tax=Haloplanus natans TaxID=376171 RepID=UPI0006779A50|nr:redoxin domain-containing protein [Haloplanus natans]
MHEVREFSLPNVGPGPDPFTLDALDADVAFVVLLFQRDYYCTNCRSQVQAVADRIDDFRARDATPVSILPESVERADAWQERYELPYPLLADPDADVSDAYDQPVRFGFLGRFSDFLGRMPEVVILDRRVDPPSIAYVHQGRSTFDRPSVDDLLGELDALREA